MVHAIAPTLWSSLKPAVPGGVGQQLLWFAPLTIHSRALTLLLTTIWTLDVTAPNILNCLRLRVLSAVLTESFRRIVFGVGASGVR
jgi:hypothetical protein